AVLVATLTNSTLTATSVLAGVAIVIAIGECAQFIVIGPIVADLAPPHLLGRYMSLFGLSFTVGVALGPAVGGVLPATSPDAVWSGGALVLAMTGAGLLRLGDRIPEPPSPTQSVPIEEALESTRTPKVHNPGSPQDTAARQLASCGTKTSGSSNSSTAPPGSKCGTSFDRTEREKSAQNE